MELRPGYKQTEAGMIPDEWKVSTVGQEFDIQLGKMLDVEKNIGVLKPYLNNKAVQWGEIDIAVLPHMAMSRYDLIRFRLRLGDLLVCEGGEVGRAAIWEAPIDECYYQKALHRLRPLRGFLPYLMFAYLKYWSEHDLFSNFVTQTSIAHLTKEQLADVPLPVPEKTEQRAITNALSDVDVLLSSLSQLLVKKRDVKQATMQQLLTGKRRLPGFCDKWEVKELGELLDYEQPTKYLVKNSEYNNNYQIPVLTAGKTFLLGYTCEEFGVYDSLPAIIFDDFTTAVKYVTFPFKAKSSAIKILKSTDENTNLRFVFDRMQLIDFKIGDHKRYWISEYRKQRIEIPTPAEQTAITAILSHMDAELTSLEQKRDKMKLIKQGMMQELLTGKTRLV